jgi:hypothetical protein
MSTSKNQILVIALVLLSAGLVWLFQAPFRAPPTVGPSVTVGLLTNSPGSGATFCITNSDARAILLTDLIVETNSPAGWRAFSHTVPTHPQRLATGDTKDVMSTAPTSVPWRLRVTYGKDVKGPILFLAKAEYAISHHTWPGGGFGVMAGSNSCVSAEMTK